MLASDQPGDRSLPNRTLYAVAANVAAPFAQFVLAGVPEIAEHLSAGVAHFIRADAVLPQ
jgi:hypothetical protein